MTGMDRNSSMSDVAEGAVKPDLATKPSRKRGKARARAIVAHIEAAIARQAGIDITDLTDEELIEDLRRHRKRD